MSVYVNVMNDVRLFELDDDNEEFGATNEEEVVAGGEGASGRPSGWGIGWVGKRAQGNIVCIQYIHTYIHITTIRIL